MFFEEVLEKKYEETFDKVYNNLSHQKKNDKNFSKEDIRNLLESMKIYEGMDKDGRGVVFETTQAATVAALTRLVVEWEEEEKVNQ
ncbi:hypothetical protein [Anaerotalea alkaliphila]|uniref:Uncharacterized protein n=1 Tax=Anaerotalea alkaliphila TaxID=2662126 RepID=A0A7X5HX46_9FIRM|nr:hypothetical protein [Anaerotalea alkaliphila]NDL68289.1 hypothetical protein [Anaerotalea alkaliphila]